MDLIETTFCTEYKQGPFEGDVKNNIVLVLSFQFCQSFKVNILIAIDLLWEGVADLRDAPFDIRGALGSFLKEK